MRKKEIDFFAILLGVVIGALICFFVCKNIDTIEDIDDVISTEEVGNIYIVQARGNSISEIDQIKARLDILNIYYEYYNEFDKHYLFLSIHNNLKDANERKSLIESYGIKASIRSEYLMDLPNNCFENQTDYFFYKEVIECLMKSMNKEQFEISSIYYENPVNINIFSNLTLLMSIKNDEIRKNYELNTYVLLIKNLK